MERLTRAEVIDRLCRRRLVAMAPTERLAVVQAGWWEGPPVYDRDPDDAASDPTRLLHVVYEDGYPHLVQPESPASVEDPRYDPIILGALRWEYLGVTNEYICAELEKVGYSTVTVTGGPEPLLPCPCCGYRTIEVRGDYEICPVCNWEDDGNRDPHRHSSANGLTLGQARRNFEAFGACCPESAAAVDRTPRKYNREPGWPT